MKKKMILAGTLVLMMVGFLSAQYCPSPTSTRSGVYYGGLSSSSAYFTLNNYAFDVRRTLERGFNSGELTQHEVNVLEFDLERLLLMGGLGVSLSSLFFVFSSIKDNHIIYLFN